MRKAFKLRTVFQMSPCRERIMRQLSESQALFTSIGLEEVTEGHLYEYHEIGFPGDDFGITLCGES